MSRFILCLLFLLVWSVGVSQDISSDKKIDFTALFEQVQNETPVFEITLFKIDENLVLSFYTSPIIFPLVEEKQMMDFSKGTRQNGFSPNISFDNVYQPKPSFTIRSSYRQQRPGAHKILKGYDYCLRPIY